MTDFMPSQEQRGEPTVTSLKAELATAREDYDRACHSLFEAHGMLKDARAELKALKRRLAGLSARWRNTHDAMTCAKAAADLDAVIGDA